MNDADIRTVVLETLLTIAPEVEVDNLRADKPLRKQVDLDSMDWLNFLLGLHDRIKVGIPEADYAKLVTLDDVVSYLTAKLGAAA